MSDNTSSITDPVGARRLMYSAHLAALSGHAMVLKAAEAAGLPAPWVVSIQSSTLHVSTATELDVWAEWLDAETEHVRHRDAVHHEAHGEKFDLPLTVVWIERDVPAARIPRQTPEDLRVQRQHMIDVARGQS